MTNLSSGISLLDHSLNAMLMLSYVALKQGDSVGLLCFSDSVHAYIPPQGGMKQRTNSCMQFLTAFPACRISIRPSIFVFKHHCKKRLAGGLDYQLDRRGECLASA